ncbi:MAG: FAD-dependent oxidoreductase [Verrucomicrobiota bacterium]|jgi:pyruvate/2-oxoglutarate dehydrogenase complex dihydrolipoamide dehydrogenase (E3) component
MSVTQCEFDLVVIGGGSGGYAAARTAAAAGLKTAVVEGGPQVGGLCILRGCMPTKALLYAAEVLHLARHAGTWGLRPGTVGFDWEAVLARKNRLIADFADFRVKQLNDGRFTFIRDQARFAGPHTLELAQGGRLTAKHFVVATGSVVAEPPLPSLAAVGYLTSDDALQLPRPPRSLIVLGGGPVAVELAQFLARFGTEVTLVQRSAHILRDSDEDAARVVEGALRREGLRVFTGTRLLDAGRNAGGKFVEFEHAGRRMRVEAEDILLALGRSPNTAGLALDRAGVRTERGRIITDAAQRTSASHIFAAGDCTGPYEIVHIAIQQGETAVHNVLHPDAPRQMDYRLLTAVVFSEPQVGVVGLTEKVARERGVRFLAASYPFNDHGKSLIMEALDGFVKLLADPVTGEILGGACVGPLGGELIHEIVVAMQARLTVAALAATPHYHPTLAEIWTYPAEELAGQVAAGTRGI